MPNIWKIYQCPGEDWLTIFLSAFHTSLHRCTWTNQHTACNELSKRNISSVLSIFEIRTKLALPQHWSLSKVIPEEGAKHVGELIFSKWYIFVSLCSAISAVGICIHISHFLLRGGPTRRALDCLETLWCNTKACNFLLPSVFSQLTSCSLWDVCSNILISKVDFTIFCTLFHRKS